ncbi:TetR/AcrR family transcriptional regulator [Amycolatopsis suaedae]|uniref:TetR/AcrR family transcriptional regulator n=1 Tax=Amycolatopsis suaedae TaxID=2510978 RepID=A0A4Q7JBS9_9PSEU|nr:TetR/AcrR family transcriptional regulator [Amycolatopsis suaedae]RZQ63734.1 TetR/AcrR family transcriptional regulator [Amycolatopsis suaedae]
MQVNHDTQPDTGRTVTEQARRAQIIGAAVEVIAELGYARASFARIVERAGLSSTRMISYHFADKAELMSAIIGTVFQVKDEFLGERIDGTTDRAALLRAYITSEVEFLGRHPDGALAVAEICANARDSAGTQMFNEPVLREMRVGRIERQLRQGQREGVFGEFDVPLMALAIRQAIDGVATRLAAEPDLDLAHCGRELANLFDRATRV